MEDPHDKIRKIDSGGQISTPVLTKIGDIVDDGRGNRFIVTDPALIELPNVYRCAVFKSATQKFQDRPWLAPTGQPSSPVVE